MSLRQSLIMKTVLMALTAITKICKEKSMKQKGFSGSKKRILIELTLTIEMLYMSCKFQRENITIWN